MNIQQAIEIVSKTDCGKVRSHNEDSLSYDTASGLAVLADGMGGYNAGEIASNIAITVISSQVKHHQGIMRPEKTTLNTEDVGEMILRESVQKANTEILNASRRQAQYAGMGTTVVSTLFYDNRMAVAHVGDSRVYRLRADTFESITHDHSLLQQQIDAGLLSQEEARFSRIKNLLTRAIGIENEVEVETRTHPVNVGDIYLLCSDGLNTMVDDELIGSVLISMQSNLHAAAERLIQLANDNGGQDNVSVILIKINADFAAPVSRLKKLLRWLNKRESDRAS